MRRDVAQLLERYEAVMSAFDEIPAVGNAAPAVDALIYEMRACELQFEALRKAGFSAAPVPTAESGTVPILCRLHAVYAQIRRCHTARDAG